MALGGVAAGSMNAQEAATVAGMHKTRGEIPMLSAVAARMGRDGPTNNNANRLVTMTPMMFTQMPAFTICGMVK